MEDLEQYVHELVNVLMQQMDRRQGHTTDMDNWLQLFSFDVIGMIALSKRFGSTERVLTMEPSPQSQKSWNLLARWAKFHDYSGSTTLSCTSLAIIKGVNARHSRLRAFTMREVEAQKGRGTDRKDISSKLFTVNKEKPAEFDPSSVISMITNNIGTGNDATAISLQAILCHLLKNPQYKQ